MPTAHRTTRALGAAAALASPVRLARAAGVAAVVLAAVAASACGSQQDARFLAEQPLGSETWVSIEGEPAWVTAPPARDGWFRLVTTRRSNLRRIATSRVGSQAEREITDAVRERVAAVLDAARAAAIAERVVGRTALVEHACKEEVLTPDPVPGNTMCTAWGLWEVPVAELLDVSPALDDAARVAAERALLD